MGIAILTFEKKLAQFISVIFHPLLIPTYVLLLMYKLQLHFMMMLAADYNYLLLAIVLLSTCILPALIMLILLKLNVIKTLQMESRQERVAPLIIMAVFFYGTHYFLRQLPYDNIFNLFMLGATMLILISLIINYVTKISIHMVAQGGLVGTFMGLALRYHYEMSAILYLLVFMAGITAYARLRLSAHTQTQIYSGFLLGALTMLLLFTYT